MLDRAQPTYFVNDDHSTRCGEPFGRNYIIAHMVFEQAMDGCHADDFDFIERNKHNPYVNRGRLVAVCDACVIDKEITELDADAICAGCDRPMRVDSRDWIRRCRYVCSNRCEARARRRRKRALQALCENAACKTLFTPKRTDAKPAQMLAGRWSIGGKDNSKWRVVKRTQ